MDPKRKSIQKYFNSKFPKWALILIAIGLIMLLVGFSSKDAIPVAVFGLLLAAAGGFGIYNYTQTPTDQQIDQWTREDLLGLDQKALNKTGIDKSEVMGEPVTITGPADFAVYKVGKDRIIRFGKIVAVVINFTQNQLLVYSCNIDVTTGNTLKESTDEYFYRDVVSVSTKTEDGQIGGTRVSAGEYFTLTTSGGTSVKVFLQSPEIGKQLGGEMPSTDADRAIQAIRKMLREKKAAA
jgi:hypothetical protein